MSALLIGVVTVIYVGVAVSEWHAGHSGMALAFAGYALANIGLIQIAMQ